MLLNLNCYVWNCTRLTPTPPPLGRESVHIYRERLVSCHNSVLPVYHPDPKQGIIACGCSTCYNHMLLYLIRNMNCRDLFKFWYLVGYVAYNWVRGGIQPPINYWVVVVKWLHNYSLLWIIPYYVCSDQPHIICPQLTTDLSFLKFSNAHIYKQSACHISIHYTNHACKTKPSNFDLLLNFIKCAIVLM